MTMEKRGVIDDDTPEEQPETKEASREPRDHPTARAADESKPNIIDNVGPPQQN